MTPAEQKQVDAYVGMVSQALIATRCIGCGWALLDSPRDGAISKRWIACDNPNCSEHGKRYAAAMFVLQPYRGKVEID